MYIDSFWKFLATFIVVLFPPTLFVLTGHTDEAAGFGCFMLGAYMLYGFWKIMDDL
jgi:hypothetical protein